MLCKSCFLRCPYRYIVTAYGIVEVGVNRSVCRIGRISHSAYCRIIGIDNVKEVKVAASCINDGRILFLNIKESVLNRCCTICIV